MFGLNPVFSITSCPFSYIIVSLIHLLNDKSKCTIAYFLGLITVTYSSWNVGTLIGAIASDFLPPLLTASLGVALYAMFIGLLVPNLTNNSRLMLLVVITAICNTVLSKYIASSWSLILSTLICAFVGIFFVDLKEDNSDEY